MSRRKKKFGPVENLEIIDAGAEGLAVGKHEDRVIFVPYVVPGDIVDVRITRKKKSFLYGQATRIHNYSDKRTEPMCSHFGRCGGCKWQNMDYEYQLYFKQKQVKDNLERIGKIDTSGMNDIIPSDNIYYYRNKLEFTFSDKKWFENPDDITDDPQKSSGLGFHLPGMFDKILDIDTCYLQDQLMNKIRQEVKDFAIAHEMSFYNVREQSGLLRNLIIRNTSTDEWMVIVVFGKNDEADIQGMMDHIRDTFPEITSLFFVINPKKNDDISDLEPILFSGKSYIMEELKPHDLDHALKFKIGPLSFFQTNSLQANKLYNITLEYAGLNGNELVYDLYTGTGSIANFVAHNAGQVIGLEYIAAAIMDAQENAKINKIENTEFYAGDLVRTLTPDFIKYKGKPDVIITDPPRAGMHPKVIKSILEMLPARIVYISCNPATQARDLEMLKESYKVSRIQPVDMFPHTGHVENVVQLNRIQDQVD
ncbi:MAG: 23S rRNA (uracil(1939)-C(5))-methyltransferase RlmD [Bacteroidales bacterium]|nr:23S rRNA (uracil(1939)-C(5))-methyltransferase RlmD [Bacteroidales bacterium]MCF8396979.1 23S rRNA (uracil(1939)-C(5))-methyltransferase RlmD [Bacteroidales bacterium]